MERLWCALIGYAFGCVLSAEIVSHIKTGKSIRTSGSGNPGMANVSSSLGLKWGLAVLAGDMLKTAVPIVICRYALFPAMGELASIYVGLGVAVGHNWPVWNGGHGGKGVAVTGMTSVLVSPLAGVASFLIGAAAVLISGYLAVGSAVIAVAFPLLLAALGFGAEVCAVAAALGVMIIVRHTPNFINIKKGAEKKFNLAKKLKKLKSK